ncbi:hypothetical protein [Hymenobacter canadensis]|uniref:Uncharacterized protein n=1 Tax=Hymenobacter canadensis TaxID=2999067 RepID=A0ABY7LWJ6_9BACT|nr:hypothetical protein [Hymenobacter canadensis]WBA43630.1 hypothetical protein O3303_08685 [Hymenobacter canadensis]
MAEQEKKKFYVAWYRLDGQDRYFLWWTSDVTDAAWTANDGRIPVFETESNARIFAQQQEISLEEEGPAPQNLDVTKRWLKDTRKPIDCEACLVAWNFFVDAAEGTGRRFAGQRGSKRKAWRGRIYDKLFFGTSTGMLLAPPGTSAYHPTWNKDERKFIAKVLTQGMNIFCHHVYQVT